MIVQVQRDRLTLNWRKLSDSHTYPSYTVLRKQFKRIFEKFSAFVGASEFGSLALTGIEFGYVNLIPLQTELRTSNELAEIFNIVPEGYSRDLNLQQMTGINWQAQFSLKGARGHLHAAVQTAQLVQNGSAALRCDLVSRWFAPEVKPDDIFPWLDTAHERTVTAFVALTSEKIQRLEWERTQ